MRMQPILVSCQAPFRSKMQKTTGPVDHTDVIEYLRKGDELRRIEAHQIFKEIALPV